jgi:hypothetical protein
MTLSLLPKQEQMRLFLETLRAEDLIKIIINTSEFTTFSKVGTKKEMIDDIVDYHLVEDLKFLEQTFNGYEVGEWANCAHDDMSLAYVKIVGHDYFNGKFIVESRFNGKVFKVGESEIY